MNTKKKFLRSNNPVLKEEAFKKLPARSTTERMTIDGTVTKTAVLLLILITAAGFAWELDTWGLFPTGWVLTGALGAFLVGLFTIYNKPMAPYTTPIYAVLEGLALGAISNWFETRYGGIVPTTVFLTFGTLAGLLIAYRSGLIRPTENFKLGVASATIGIASLYLIDLVARLFGGGVPVLHEGGLLGILVSGFIVVIAALNLVLDFDFIEQGVNQGAPKYMEWYGAFGLLVTLVWIYLEILDLLAKLSDD